VFSRVLLPRGRHLALTWGIRDGYGGMTHALLHRSRTFAELGGTPVTVLTLDDFGGYDELEATLRDRGEISGGVRFLNLWDDLRERTLATHASANRITHEPLEPRTDDVLVTDAAQRVLARERHDVDGSPVGIDRFRVDGSPVGIDRFRVDGSLLATHRWADGRQFLVLHDALGTPVRSFSSSWALYRWWLDVLLGDEPAYLIVDSKVAARFVHTYRRDSVVTVHVVHGSHRAHSGIGLRPTRLETLDHLADYDGIVVLTESQRRDVEEVRPGSGNLHVIPNASEDPAAPGTAPARRRGTAVVVAGLSDRKRVGDAVTAAASAGVPLDIFGDGERRTEVEAAIRATGADATLHGWVPDSRTRLGEYDVLLLTSTSEGLPLVLVEAMAAGCLPIAYDIRYGPADVITDGVDGWIVPDGDTAAMAAAIRRAVALDDAEIERMRSAARRRAQQFGERAVTEKWAGVLRAAARRKPRGPHARGAMRRFGARIVKRLGSRAAR
jgi:poly(glycerol-phosphate) alpha-glucosyltransferase